MSIEDEHYPYDTFMTFLLYLFGDFSFFLKYYIKNKNYFHKVGRRICYNNSNLRRTEGGKYEEKG